MTQPSASITDLLTTDVNTEMTVRPSYLTLLPLQEDTLARATDINTIQTNVDDALQLFAGDVNLALQNMLTAIVYRMMLLERKEAAFEAQIADQFQEYQDALNAQMEQLRLDIQAQLAKMKADLTAYTDTKVMTEINALERRIHNLFWASANWGISYQTPILGDDHNYFGGKDWDFTLGSIPAGMTLHVFGYEVNWQNTADSGSGKPELRIYWPNFAGNLSYDDGQNHDVKQFNTSTPLLAIKGPLPVPARIFINNRHGIATFTIVGKLITQALEEVLRAEGYPLATNYIGTDTFEMPSTPTPPPAPVTTTPATTTTTTNTSNTTTTDTSNAFTGTTGGTTP